MTFRSGRRRRCRIRWGASKSRAAAIANSEGSSSRGGKASGSGKRNTDSKQGGSKAQKAAAGRKGAEESNN